jgi:hypothetical protein
MSALLDQFGAVLSEPYNFMIEAGQYFAIILAHFPFNVGDQDA